ncbi:hypothetical protein E2C01_083525 [Portunus trituberculatus]|uniref:Uncharacterized protein n=1 Tax=Portunus trituberculatus TaxID=210409 RepID=A0A5B7IVE8_PORTR|nr:hypothetical protein [Portunus trituberculatus]
MAGTSLPCFSLAPPALPPRPGKFFAEFLFASSRLAILPPCTSPSLYTCFPRLHYLVCTLLLAVLHFSSGTMDK